MAGSPKASAQRAPPRKRNRKRKRRDASSSSESSDSSNALSVESEDVRTRVQRTVPKPPQGLVQISSSSSSSTDSSSSDSESVSDSNAQPNRPVTAVHPAVISKKKPRPDSPPPSAALPSFILYKEHSSMEEGGSEQALKDRFRKFWMASVADGFIDDLNEIRKETNFTTSRLGLLIDSLAAGADVYTSAAGPDNTVNEMEIVLESST